VCVGLGLEGGSGRRPQPSHSFAAKSSTNAAAKRKPTKVAVAPLASSIPGDNPPAATALEANGDNNGLVKGPWSTEEEARFLEGLELFGRSWPEVYRT